MKRLFSVIALAFAAVLALSGCVNMNAEVSIQGDDKATGTVEVTMEKEALQGLEFKDVLASQVNMDELNTQLAGVWNTTEIDNAENVGLSFTTAKTMSFTELADAFSVFGFPITLSSNGQEFSFSMPGSGQTAVDSSFTEANFAVSFPGAVVSTSGGTVDHHTVTFDLVQGAETYQATGKVDYSLIYSVIFGGALLILTLVFVLAFSPRAVKEAH
ncbi:LppM family (lipo)protein [Glutamicibacter sp. NPDC087344]|uniref:LppM family (lipo)protein n=1 Tax=Glutamicibacter sp. NPDC087344 TaxID=3363994 RepID=UPI00381FF50F